MVRHSTHLWHSGDPTLGGVERVSPVCRIVADSFERAGGVPDALRALGVTVELGGLPAGDYDLGSGVLVERKTVPDLHLSLERVRLWSQIGKLRRAAALPYLLVEAAISTRAPSTLLLCGERVSLWLDRASLSFEATTLPTRRCGCDFLPSASMEFVPPVTGRRTHSG